MAGISSKLKPKTKGHVLGLIRHNDKELREKNEHSNVDINKSLTYKNLQLDGVDAKATIEKYDEIHAKLLEHPKANRRKDSVKVLTPIIYAPDKMNGREAAEYLIGANDVYIKAMGINEDDVLNFYIHYDEVHEYDDSLDKKKKTSRVHSHLLYVPTVTREDEHGTYKVLCAKELQSKEKMKEAVQAVHEWSLNTYGIPYKDGTGRKGEKQEDLKRKSAKIASERAETLEERVKTLENDKNALKEQLNAKNERIHELERLNIEGNEALKRLSEEYASLKSVNAEGRYQVENLIEDEKPKYEVEDLIRW